MKTKKHVYIYAEEKNYTTINYNKITIVMLCKANVKI